MNGNLYFEQDPWDKAVDCMRQQDLGPVAEVSVQVVCTAGQVEAAVQKWQNRLEALLGPCTGQDVLQREGVYSAIAAYQNGAAVRLFVDDAQDDVTENFEIITQKALLVWKADVHPQGHMLAENASFFESTQPYSIQLEVK